MTNFSDSAQSTLSGAELALEQALRTRFVDLASERVGGETLSCSDDFFAPMENLLKPGRGVYRDEVYTERGKWMDGWESRRSYGRNNGRDHDWCVVRLGMTGVIKGVDIDTHHFRGNAPLQASLDACHTTGEPDARTHWQTLLPPTDLKAHAQNVLAVVNDQHWTHVRLNIFPDGGVARLRIYGEAVPDWTQFVDNELIDLAALTNGGRSLLVSDMFFSDKNNLLLPGRGINMGDGWETRRRRDPGPDWNIIRLACPGHIAKVIVDTRHFKGNYPDRFMLEGCLRDSDDFIGAAGAAVEWQPILMQTPLQPHREHLFTQSICAPAATVFSHVRLSIFPDGGISRLRIFGRPARAPTPAA